MNRPSVRSLGRISIGPCGATQQVVRQTGPDRGCREAHDGSRDGDRRSMELGTKAGYAGNGLSMEK